MKVSAVTAWFFATLIGLCSVIAPSLFDVGYGGFMVPIGSAGSFWQWTFWLSFTASIISGIMARTQGEKWPIVVTIVLYAVLLIPTMMLLAACLSGNCL